MIKLTQIYIQSQTTNASYNEIAEIMKKTAEKVLSKVRTKKYSWMTNELLDLCEERRILKSIKNTSTENAQEYRKVNSILRKCMKDTTKYVYINNVYLWTRIYEMVYTTHVPIKYSKLSQIRARRRKLD